MIDGLYLYTMNIGTPYHDRPVEKSPEFMRLDNSLNQYLKNSPLYHCVLAAHLSQDDVRHHSMAIPRTIERRIQHIWNDPEGPPNSSCIVHDCLLAIDTIYTVYQAKI